MLTRVTFGILSTPLPVELGSTNASIQMPASAKSATVSTAAPKKPARKTRARKAPATPRTRKAAANPTPQPVVQVAPVVTLKQKEFKAWQDLFTLRGIEIVVLPLIFLEAWAVQILNNAGLEVSVPGIKTS